MGGNIRSAVTFQPYRSQFFLQTREAKRQKNRKISLPGWHDGDHEREHLPQKLHTFLFTAQFYGREMEPDDEKGWFPSLKNRLRVKKTRLDLFTRSLDFFVGRLSISSYSI